MSTATAAPIASRDPSAPHVLWAAATLRDFLTGEDRRRILEAGRSARYTAAYHPDCRGVLAAGQLDEIESRASAECAAGIVDAFLLAVPPIRGGSPEAAPVAAPKPKATPKPRAVKPAHGTASLTLKINGTPYGVKPIACQAPAAQKCYELRKADGTAYHVSQHAHGLECDCPDFVYHRDGLDPAGCKHLKSCEAFGLLACPAPDSGGQGDARDPFPRRIRSGQGTAPSDRYRERDNHPGLDTSRGGHQA